jgi:sulfur relay (sulfurtransferase) DsrF/TusC family protein
MQGKQLCILVRQAPYTTISAAEAVRHAGGALAEGLAVNVLLVDEGVFLACESQNAGQTGFVSLSGALRKIMDKGAKVLVLDVSAEMYGLLKSRHLMEGVSVVDGPGAAQQLAEADALMLY